MLHMGAQLTIWIVIGIYAVFMLVVGVMNSKGSKSISDFTVGKRSAGGWITALSYGTAYFSAVMFIGYSGGSGWSFGLWSILPGIGNAVIGSLLAWMVLARRTRETTNRLQIKSMPQFFEQRYQSRGIKFFSCIVIFLFLLPYSASVYKGLTSVCSVLLGVNERVCMDKITGRTDDMIIVKGVNVFPSQVESVLVGMDHIGPHYQLVVRRGANLLDTLEAKVELTNGDLLEHYSELEALQKNIHDRLKSVLGLETKVTLVEPKTLERFQGKAKRVLDLRNVKE